MLTAIGLALLLLGFACVFVACSMDLAPKEASTRPAAPKRSRKKLHRLSKMKRAA